MKRQIAPGTVPAPVGPYSPGILSGGFLFVAGQGPFDAAGLRVGDTFEAQVRKTMENISEIARAAGTSLSGTVRMGAYLSSMDHFDEFNSIVREYLPEPFPARTTIPVALRGFDVEIDVIIRVSQ